MENYLKSQAPRIQSVEYTYTDVNDQEQAVSTSMLIMPAIIKAIPEHKYKNKSKKQAEWRLITVSILNPVSQKTEDVSAQLFESSLKKFSDLFVVDGEIEIAVQTEGKYAGYAKAQLQSTARVNVKDIVAFLNAKAEMPAPASTVAQSA